MFIIATKRKNVIEKWQKILEKHGATYHVDSMSALYAIENPNDCLLLILDFQLADANEPKQWRYIKQTMAQTKLLLYGAQFAPSAELEALAAGVSGCLDPRTSPKNIEKTVDVVLQGGVWLSKASIPILANKLQSFFDEKATSNSTPVANSSSKNTTENRTQNIKQKLDKLTKREREVAELVRTGANNKIIAQDLAISDRTVKAHLTSIYEKLEVPDRIHLALQLAGE